MLKRGEDYKDLGGNYFDQQNSQARARHYTKRLEKLSYTVQVVPQVVAQAA